MVASIEVQARCHFLRFLKSIRSGIGKMGCLFFSECLISEAEFEDALALLDNAQPWAGQGGDREELRRSLLRARNSSLLQRRIKGIFDLGQSDPEVDISEMAVDLPPTD